MRCSGWLLIFGSTCIAIRSTSEQAFNSLAVMVEQSMGLNPLERAVFAFCNRRRDRMKLLFYDRSGFLLLLKRLEVDKFHWPRRQLPVLTLTTEQLHWLLEGIDIEAVRRHPERHYHSIG